MNLKKDEKIKVINRKIVGIHNPMLTIELDQVKMADTLSVFADSQEIDYSLFPISEEKLIIESKLPEKCKEVFVVVNRGNESFLITALKNRKELRTLNKVRDFIWKFIVKIKILFIVLGRGIRFLWREHHFLVPPTMYKKYLKDFWNKMTHGGSLHLNPFIQADYLKWLEKNESFETNKELSYQPKISVLIPVYNIRKELLSQCLDSILNQTYENFEICIADDCSTNPETIATLKEYMEKDSRIKVVFRKENGHISAATNDALSIATGDFVGLVDNDDVLSPHALYENIVALNNNEKLDFIYSDEDKLDVKGLRCDPNFKPNYSPDTLLSLNYICHFAVIRRSLINEIGGFTLGLEGAQDFDLFLRLVEKTDQIYHIPKILYHWRMVEGSTSMTIDNKSYAADKGKIALENALKRRGINGLVHKDENSSYYYIEYLFEKEPTVSIIIPTRDFADVTRTCIQSIYEKTDYDNYEVMIVNNNSEKEETFSLFDEYKKKHSNFMVIDANFEFNYSRINNLAVEKSNSDIIVLLNNDTEVISPNWLKIIVGYASQEHIGAVGPKLLYPDNSVQHAGVILGLGGVASHAYIGSGRDDLGMYGRLSVPYNYAAVTAACLAVKRSKFLAVAGLEENLKVAYNDIDFNIKLLEKGYYNVFVPNVELYHFESKSRGLDTTGEKYKRFLEESEYMYRKWDGVIETDQFYNPNFSKNGWFVLDK